MPAPRPPLFLWRRSESMADTILVVNAGSSSLKFSTFPSTGVKDLTLLLKGQIDGIGVRPRLAARDAPGPPLVPRPSDRERGGRHPAPSPRSPAWLQPPPRPAT